MNPYNGNLNFWLPLLEVRGRGDAKFTISLPINQKWRIDHRIIHPHEAEPIERFLPLPDWWSNPTPYSAGTLEGRSVSDFFQTCGSSPSVPNQTLTRMTFTAENGTEYELVDQLTGGRPLANYCGQPAPPSRGRVFVTTDGSASTFISDSDISDDVPLSGSPSYYHLSPTGYLFMRDGTRYRIEDGNVTSIRDRNGNEVTISAQSVEPYTTTITDSLGRIITITPILADPPDKYDEIVYHRAGNSDRTIRVYFDTLDNLLRSSQWTVQTPAQLFPELEEYGANSVQAYNPTRVAYVLLPDDACRYSFRYNVYGELARVELPTGGAFEYDWDGGTSPDDPGVLLGFLNIYRRVIERRVYADGVTLSERTTYSRPETPNGLYQYDNLGYVQVDHRGSDPLHPVIATERHHFHGSPANSLSTEEWATSYPAWKDGKEYQTVLGMVGEQAGLKQLDNLWNQSPPSWWSGDADLAPANDPMIYETSTTLLDSNQVSRQSFDYDQYKNLTDIYEYDYGVGVAGSLIRHQHIDFLTTLNGTSYDTLIPNSSNPDPDATIHLRSLATSRTVRDAGEVERAQTSYEYDNYTPDSNHAALMTRQGAVGVDSAFSRSARGNVTAVTRWLNTGGSLTGYSQFDVLGNVVKKIDPRGNATEIDYAGTFQYAWPTTITLPVPDPTGQHGSTIPLVTHSDYDFSTGKVVSTTDANGNMTQFTYDDPLDRLTLITNPDGGLTTFDYHDNEAPLPSVEARQDLLAPDDQRIKHRTVYDGLGRVVQTQLQSDPQGTVYVTTVYDAMGRVWTVTNPYRGQIGQAPSTVTLYDALSRVSQVSHSDGSVTQTDYFGNATKVTDEAGRPRRSITDALGRLARLDEPEVADLVNSSDLGSLELPTQATSYTYDVLDNLRSVTHGGQSRTYEYDSLSRLLSASNPESRTVSYRLSNGQPGYDGNGNLLRKVDDRGTITTYEYDAINRVTAKGYSAGADTADTADVSYVYDTSANGKGRLTSVTNGDSTTSYSYDSMGRITQSTQTTDSVSYPFSYTYDLAGNLASQTYPSGRTILIGSDDAGRVAGIQQQSDGHYLAGGGVADSANRIEYAPHGSALAIRLGNGLWEQWRYNDRLQVSQIGLGSARSPDSATGLTTSYADKLLLTYGYAAMQNNGNVASQEIQIGNSCTMSQTYEYDYLNRITAASEASNGGTPWPATSYGIDRFGNRWVRPGSYMPSPGTPQSGGEFDPLTNRMTSPSVYDDAGNLKLDKLGNSYLYDAENRLKDYNGIATYTYDGDGRRVKKQAGGTTTTYVYDYQGRLSAEYSNGSADTPGIAFITPDHLGSTRITTDRNQAIRSRRDYLPYGEEIEAQYSCRTSAGIVGYGAAESTRQRFSGKERDPESGLDYFGARYFSSPQGRFTTPDNFLNDTSARGPQSWNLYAYVRNNPLRYVDPNGDMIYVGGLPQNDEDELLKRLRATYGCQNCVSVNSKGFLQVDTSGLSKDMLKATDYLTGAINSTTFFANVQISNNDPSLAFGEARLGASSVEWNGLKVNASLIRLDFGDDRWVGGDSAAKQTFLNTVFAHEVAHLYPTFLSDPRTAGPTGPVVDRVNQITDLLGEPRRTAYVSSPVGGYWLSLPFSKRTVDKNGQTKQKAVQIEWMKRNVGGKGVN